MSVTYIDAIHDAQTDLLAEDKDVFLYGQDIGVFGGAFKATKGLKELFPDRVIDAPLSEDAMAGRGTGAAVMGKKPIMEVQLADFSTIAFNQIVNIDVYKRQALSMAAHRAGVRERARNAEKEMDTMRVTANCR